MKNTNNPRRGRSRSNGKRRSSQGGRNFDGGGGGEAKVRGTARQVLDKYLVLARDAASAGNRVASEGYLQHAEHYYRVLNSEPSGDEQNVRNRKTPLNHEDPKPERAPERDNKAEGVAKENTSGDKTPVAEDEAKPEPTPKSKVATA